MAVFATQFGPKAKNVNARDRERLFFLLSMMMKCGQTTPEALRSVGKAFVNEGQKDIAAAMTSIAQKVSQGRSMSKAMEAEHILFNDIHRAAIMAGEASSDMQNAFNTLRTLEEQKMQASRAGMSEILTPLLMLVLSLVSMFNTGLNTLPVMKNVAEAQGKPLGPLPQGVMNITQAIAAQWVFVAAALALVVTLYFSLRGSVQGKRLLDKWYLAIPIYGKFLAYRTYTNMLLYFPYMIKSGVKPKQMLPIMDAMATNYVLKRRVDHFNQVITTGGSMSAAMHKAGFPEIAVTPVNVSENFAGEGTTGVNNVMIEGMEHAHKILDRMLNDTHSRFIAVTSTIMWLMGGSIMLIDMVSIVLSQA